MNEPSLFVADVSSPPVHPEGVQGLAYGARGTRARVLVVDRPGWVYHGSAAVSNRRSELEVVGRALDVTEAIRMAVQSRPDVVVINLPVDGARAIDAVQQLHQSLPEVRIIAFASHATGTLIRAVTDSGASALLFKDDDSEMLAEVVRIVMEGNRYYSPVWMPLFLADRGDTEPFDPRVLTRREWEVIQLIYEGKTSRAIGGELGIELTTVHAHRSNIMKKLNIHNVAGLVKWYELHRPVAQ